MAQRNVRGMTLTRNKSDEVIQESLTRASVMIALLMVAGLAVVSFASMSGRIGPALLLQPPPPCPTAPPAAGHLASLAGCAAAGPPPPYDDPTGFPAPQFGPGGGQYAEADYGWTVSGALDNRPAAAYAADAAAAAAAAAGLVPGARRRGAVKDYRGRARDAAPAGEVAERGGLSLSCGCAVCPCRGDGDLDVADNGDWAWPIETRGEQELKSTAPTLPPPSPAPCCAPPPPPAPYTAIVQEIPRRIKARVYLPTSTRKVTRTKPTKSTVKTKERVVYRTLYKEKTVYVPVYDDPYWNPATDGRLSGEGVGLGEGGIDGRGDRGEGAWFEGHRRRRTLLDPLGGSVDTDRDIDDPVDLGLWWSDSLPSDPSGPSLSDGFYPSNQTRDNEFEAR